MAEKRMFSISIIDSDAFLDMPTSTQALYFHLGMRADDDGFINNPRMIMRIVKASEDDMNVLIAKKFILQFDSGIIVIKHWRINNYLRSDRKKNTNYQDEFKQLEIDYNGAYKLVGIPSANQLGAQYSIDKISLEEISIDKNKKPLAQVAKNKHQYYENEDLNNLFNEFLGLRKKLKAVNTERAVSLLLGKLEPYSDELKEKMIEQSITNSWKGIFPIKVDFVKEQKKPNKFENIGTTV